MTAFKTGGLKAGLSAAGSHIQGGLKDVMEKPGVTGFATRSFTTNIKKTTGLDIAGFQKNLEKGVTEEKTRLATIANKGEKAAKIEQTQLKNKESMINDAGAEAAMKIPKEKDHIEKEKYLSELTGKKKGLEDKVKAAEEKLKNAGTWGEKAAAKTDLDNLNVDLKTTTLNFSVAEAKVKDFQEDLKNKQLKASTKAREDMAKQLGMELNMIDNTTGAILKDREGNIIETMDVLKESNRQRIRQETKKKDEFIRDIVKNGGFKSNILAQKDRDELAESLIADTYSPVDKKKLQDAKELLDTLLGAGNEAKPKNDAVPPKP